jgi:hypothetical protein
MSVTFTEELVEIKEYIIDKSYKKEKRAALQNINKNLNEEIYIIRNMLYKKLPTEEGYIERRNKGNRHGGIKFIKGYIGNYNKNFKILYSEKGRFIEYSTYENKNGKVINQIETKGFGMSNAFFRKIINVGDFYEDMFKAEYQSKMFIIETLRRLFNENDIM